MLAPRRIRSASLNKIQKSSRLIMQYHIKQDSQTKRATEEYQKTLPVDSGKLLSRSATSIEEINRPRRQVEKSEESLYESDTTGRPARRHTR
jgi:hypothetical protein